MARGDLLRQHLNHVQTAMADIETMHGSVIGDPEVDHSVEPIKCRCIRGLALRYFANLESELLYKLRKFR